MTPAPPITVAITTRDRPLALARCLAALEQLGDLAAEILVADDASREPLAPVIASLPEGLRRKVRVLAMPENPGYIVGRNRLARAAACDAVLFLDDDAFVIDAAAVHAAAGLLAGDASVAVVAYAQAEADGRPWPPSMQPSAVSYPCVVPSFIGFAHLMRRSAFLAVGPYDESYVFYGEEKDWCLRAMDAGFRVVYLPSALIAHVPAPGGRDPVRYLRQVTRNDCWFALRREPLPLPLVSVPLRLMRYLSMRRHGRVVDPGGFWWLLGQVARAVPSALASRRVRWSTLRRWRATRRHPPEYIREAMSHEPAPAGAR